MSSIASLRAIPLNVSLLEPFGIASGAQHVAENVLIELTLDDGTVGLGEAAPFPAVNGETQTDVLDALPRLFDAWSGASILPLRTRSEEAAALLGATPSAVAGAEMALLDAYTRRAKLPLWSLFGGKELRLRSDITIVTGDVLHAIDSAKRATAAGFDLLKMKIGGSTIELDLARIRAIAELHSDVKFILDANAALSSAEALYLLRELGEHRRRIVLFEQPTPAHDLDELARVTRDGGVPVAADESARSVSDVVAIAEHRAAQVINIKTMKVGVFAAWDMMRTARSLGLELMVGGMVETELAMSVSACLGGGFGGVSFFDLDTPLFLGPRPLSGGFAQEGPTLDLKPISAGHGVRFLG